MTGTGSGKTECFLLPILGKLAKEAKTKGKEFGKTSAVRAMVLYPMNALVNDQLGRLRLLLGEPIDPLYLHPLGRFRGAVLFGQPIDYEIQAESDHGAKVIGKVRVTFSELPVHEWHKFSNDEKRRLGISKGAGVSIVRAGREVDYGWFFLGGKARENYDDWWRCEIQFDPVLDEAFGITHTKQQIRPKVCRNEWKTALP